MVHESRVLTVKIKGRPMNVTDHRSRFLEKTSGGGIVPDASPTLLRFGELEMASRSLFQSMAGVDYSPAIVNRRQTS